MKNKLFFIFILLATLNCFASFTFNNGKHAIIFDSDTTVGLTVSGDTTGFGYYLNNDKTFFLLTEEDLKKALEFKEGDEVRFVKQKKNGTVLKMTTSKTENGIQLYKIGGNGNGGISFSVTIIDKPYTPSGQPLPHLYFSIFLASSVLSAMIIVKSIKK